MESYVIAVDQSTSATKAFLYNEEGMLLGSAGIPHRQYYPREGWVEHDPEEIYVNTVKVIQEVAGKKGRSAGCRFTLAVTNQRETVVVWERKSGRPVCNAIVWQCTRGWKICERLKAEGLSGMVRERSGLLIDPYFAGSGVKWILDNVGGARESAEKGELCMGTIDSWLIFRLTRGAVHATDYTNASRTMLFNIHSLDWDEELMRMLDIPGSMLPGALPSDAVFGETMVEDFFEEPVRIAGVIGDSHGALAGQMCFTEGLGKVTYGTGSSVMVNIGESPADAPDGLVTSIGYAALGKVFYAFEGNIHCTGATIAWLKDELQLIERPEEAEKLAVEVGSSGGVYFIPAFTGLGAPWWHPEAKAQICGMTLGSGRKQICRAALESIGFQVRDLVDAMTDKAGISLKEIRVDGGPTKNRFLMQFQTDLLKVSVVRSEMEDASAYGAFVMNAFARGKWTTFEEAASHWSANASWTPLPENEKETDRNYEGWKNAVSQLIK